MVKWFIRIFVVAVCLGILGFAYGWHLLRTARGDAVSAQTIIIPDGASAQTIGRILAQAHVIASERLWTISCMRHTDACASLQAGVYTIDAGQTIRSVQELLASGHALRRDKAITIPEGWTIAHIADRLTANGFDGDAFRAFVTNPSDAFRTTHPILTSLPAHASLEGYLFPDTYFFLPETTVEDMAHAMVRNTEKKISQEDRARIVAAGRTVHAVVTMASIIEREAVEDQDRPIIGGIFYNRLAQNMPLQSDATIDYIMGASKVKHTLEDLAIQSPYNTYQHAGLPPGPIGNPGINSLRAAIMPRDTAYLFFLHNAVTQKTVYAETFEQHVANKNANGL